MQKKSTFAKMAAAALAAMFAIALTSFAALSSFNWLMSRHKLANLRAYRSEPGMRGMSS